MAPVSAHASRPGPVEGVADRVALTHEARLLRRRLVVTEAGEEVLVDLPAATALSDGDALVLADGRVIAVIAAEEDLMEVRAATPEGLARLAWHVGNRHAPCQIAGDRLILQRERVMEAMLTQLGAEVTALRAPFVPEGGAYGHGRTMGHSHGHGHDHDHAAPLAGLGAAHGD